MAKTPDYILKATKTYRDKHDIIQVRFPKGTREKIDKVADNVNSYIVSAVEEKLNGKQQTPLQRTQKPVEAPKTNDDDWAKENEQLRLKQEASKKVSLLSQETEKVQTKDRIGELIGSITANKADKD